MSLTYTYNDTLPTALDRMRLVLGDTNVSDPANALLPDETYLAALSGMGETDGTRFLADSLATRFAQVPDSVSDSGDVITWRDRVKTWLEISRRLRADVAGAASATANTATTSRARRFEDEQEAEYVRPGTWWPDW